MTKKTSILGRESGKSSTSWFGGSRGSDTEAAKHGHGARAGDGRNSRDVGKIEIEYRDEVPQDPKKK